MITKGMHEGGNDYIPLPVYFFLSSFLFTVSKYSWMFDVILLRMEVFYHNIHSRYQAIDGVTRYLFTNRVLLISYS